MRLQLINPSNPLVSMAKPSRWTRYRAWKPLALMVIAGLTPPEWETTLIDENLGLPDYSLLPRPDLVGITAFTSQAPRAYEVSDRFRSMGVPVVMGGIHATACADEAVEHVDSIVTGEAEGVWARVLDDAQRGSLERRYEGGRPEMDQVPFARHDLLPRGYAFGAIQTTRGCPLDCTFCSVTSFNGARYRQRPVEDVVRELSSVPEKLVLVVDDNLIGTRAKDIQRAKDLFRALAHADLGKRWMGQATINFADDEELLELAARAGCRGIFIGFESPTPEGLPELGRKSRLLESHDLRAAVRRIQRHGIMVVGSFIIGLDVDDQGIGTRVAAAAQRYGVDILNASFLTPLPGTRLWDQLEAEERIALDSFPEDWKHYTLTYPVARYKNLSLDDAVAEMLSCNGDFYSLPSILRRARDNVWRRRSPVLSLIANISSRRNSRLLANAYPDFQRTQGDRFGA